MKTIFYAGLGLFSMMFNHSFGQEIPSGYENIDYLMTFSKEADRSWGDDDHVQTYFFSIPKSYNKNLYIRVFDPNCGGIMDQANGGFDSKTSFTVYGGKGAYSNPAARKPNPVNGFDAGTLLDSETFGSENTYEQKWFTFGPFNPKEGELQGDRYYFKIIIKGLNGNDGNGYRLALSSSSEKNDPIDDGKAFTYEVSFRLKNGKNEVAHFYPFIDNDVVSVKQNNFDFDNDGEMRITSVAKNMNQLTVSGDGDWSTSTLKVEDAEKGGCLDLQIMKKGISNNDMVIYLENQYGDAIPFFSSPIGNYHIYKYKVEITIE